MSDDEMTKNNRCVIKMIGIDWNLCGLHTACRSINLSGSEACFEETHGLYRCAILKIFVLLYLGKKKMCVSSDQTDPNFLLRP